MPGGRRVPPGGATCLHASCGLSFAYASAFSDVQRCGMREWRGAARGRKRGDPMMPGLMRRYLVTAVVVMAVAFGGAMSKATAEDVTLTVWSHEADELGKVAFRELAA